MSKKDIQNMILNVQAADDESQFQDILNFVSERINVDHFYPFRFDTSENLNNIKNWLHSDIMDSTKSSVVIKTTTGKKNLTKVRKLQMKIPKPKSTEPTFKNLDDALLHLVHLKASKASQASLENKENIGENNLMRSTPTR